MSHEEKAGRPKPTAVLWPLARDRSGQGRAPFHCAAWAGGHPGPGALRAGAPLREEGARSRAPDSFRTLSQAPEWGSRFKRLPVPRARPWILVRHLPGAGPQLFSICSISNSPSREQGLLSATRSRQAGAGSPRRPQPPSGARPSASSQHSSSWQARSSKEGARGSGTGVPAGVLPPGPEAAAENRAAHLVLPTWRAKGLRGPRSSVPELRQLRLLKVWQFCGRNTHGYQGSHPLRNPGTPAPRARPMPTRRGRPPKPWAPPSSGRRRAVGHSLGKTGLGHSTC